MLFNTKFVNESEVDDLDVVAGTADPDTEAGQEAIAAEVEGQMQVAALESVTYFENGDDAQKAFTESVEVKTLIEAGKMSKKTFVRLNKNDDLTRRAHLASLILARNKKDPLFSKLALNRVNERKLRGAIFSKYKVPALAIAKKSQKQHLKNAKTLPMPKVSF